MQQLAIGEFSRLTHLSIKTLRYYHEIGLLEPAVVDRSSGYRYYQPAQSHAAHLVKRYRDLGLPVADVKSILAAPDQDARDAILADHLERMRDQLRQTESAVESLHRMLQRPSTPDITERMLESGPTISIAANLTRESVASWWWDAITQLHKIAADYGLEQTGPLGGLFDDGLFVDEAGHARVYLPVKDSPALDQTGSRWQLPPGRFAVALHEGPHRDVDLTYTALGAYAADHDIDGSGPVRERYLTDPLEDSDTSHWETEVCWPLLAGEGPGKQR